MMEVHDRSAARLDALETSGPRTVARVASRPQLEHLISKARGCLEIEVGRRFLHLLLQDLDERFRIHLAGVGGNWLRDAARVLALRRPGIGHASAEAHLIDALRDGARRDPVLEIERDLDFA